MVVSKILEQTLAAGETSVTFTDESIPNSLIRVFSNDADLIYESITLVSTSITVTYAAQTVNKSIALEIIKSGLSIIDNLTSDDDTSALSAKQGNVLKGLIDNLPAPITELSELDDIELTSLQDGQILVYDDNESKFINADNQSNFLSPDFVSDLIYDSGNITSNYSSYSYTVQEDCWLCGTIKGAGLGSTSLIYVNGSDVVGSDNNRNIIFPPVYVRTGDVITVRSEANSTYRIRLRKSR